MPETTLSPAESLTVLSEIYNFPGRTTTPHAMITMMFGVLDGMPGPVTANDLETRGAIEAKRHRIMFKALESAECVTLEPRIAARGHGIDTQKATGTDRLVKVMEGFNRLYLNSIIHFMGETIESRTVVSSSIRAIGIVHGIDPEKPIKEIVDIVKHKTDMHTHTAMYRALGIFATGHNNLLERVESNIRALIQGRETWSD